MADKIDKEKRKQILIDVRKKAREEFEKSLPMSLDNFKMLFDYLDNELQEKKCDDDHEITRACLNVIGVENAEKILGWLRAKGGYCDCEVLANVEEQFE
jgi:hypothetical protein